MKKYYEVSVHYEEELEDYDWFHNLVLSIEYDEGCFPNDDKFRADIYINVYYNDNNDMDYVTSLRAYSFYNVRPTDEQRKSAISSLIYELRENGYRVIQEGNNMEYKRATLICQITKKVIKVRYRTYEELLKWCDINSYDIVECED